MHSPTAGVRHRGHPGEPEPGEPVKGGRCPTPTEDPDRSGSPAILGKPTVKVAALLGGPHQPLQRCPIILCDSGHIDHCGPLHSVQRLCIQPHCVDGERNPAAIGSIAPSCARLPIAAVDRRLREDPGTNPSTHRLLLEALQAGPSQHALSLHLIGGTAPTADRLVAAVAAAVGADHPSCVHLAAPSRPPKEEAARAGAACPCAVVVWDDVEQVPPFARHDFKFLFDDTTLPTLTKTNKPLNRKT
eukprot:TRINITY_DN10920_c0_g1_i1.p1 TRINITY_DN10920_c0_g1~~TRINITY_DN10920_c0_g1_i1.p1  ORF type:complete len:245 (-),score=36.24 TRINITY_DN10920_c0_g1_i1:2-736(-)